ncbi:MAG: NAAT family transporter [Cyanobacteria bacterium]|nr:NAAT family transporter [Cyanobacteriota bacterium]
MTIFSAVLLLLLVMDPFGNVPLFLSVLNPVAPERRRQVIVRELLIALAFLLVFLLAGRYLLAAIGISESVLTAAGGIILFLIALRMIFPPAGGAFATDVDEAENEPLLVPLAVPFVAGPSALASVIFIMSSDPSRWPEWLAAVILAWGITGLVLFFSADLARLLRRRGLIAIERLMGMVLTAIATKMLLTGIGEFFAL